MSANLPACSKLSTLSKPYRQAATIVPHPPPPPSPLPLEYSVSTIARAIKQLQGGPAGGMYGAPSRSGTGGSDSLTKALLATKGYAHAAGLDGSAAQKGVSGRASPLGEAGYVPSVPGAEWEGGGCADLLGGSRDSDEAAVGEGANGSWVF